MIPNEPIGWRRHVMSEFERARDLGLARAHLRAIWLEGRELWARNLLEHLAMVEGERDALVLAANALEATTAGATRKAVRLAIGEAEAEGQRRAAACLEP